jgi:epoxide hydrolase-like predicted phosphatase
MIKAVIFDLGGVLIENPSPKMINYFSSVLGVKEEEFYSQDKLPIEEFQKGLINEDTFWEKFCSRVGVKKPSNHSLWQEAFRRVFTPREEMFSLSLRLKGKGYKLGLLSNIEAPSLEYFNEQPYNDIFDVTVFSCVERTWKPERKIYEIVLKRLSVQPAEGVFIDDREDFIDGAKEIGLKTILFKSPDQVKEDLSYLF